MRASILLRPRTGRTATKLLVGLLAAAARRPSPTRPLALAADAIVEKVESTSVGLQPRVVSTLQDGLDLRRERRVGLRLAAGNVRKPGRATRSCTAATCTSTTGTRTHHYHNDWKALIDKFGESVNRDENGLDDVFAVDEQYTDITDHPAYNRVHFRGSYTDTTPYPAAGNCTDPNPLTEAKRHHIKAITCLTDAQIKTHLNEFIEEHKLPKGMNTVYYVLTPPGVSVCLDAGGASGHCSSFADHGEKLRKQLLQLPRRRQPGQPRKRRRETILYGVLPWTAGGVGDGQLATVDETEAPECQDGGFNAPKKRNTRQNWQRKSRNGRRRSRNAKRRSQEANRRS